MTGPRPTASTPSATGISLRASRRVGNGAGHRRVCFLLFRRHHLGVYLGRFRYNSGLLKRLLVCALRSCGFGGFCVDGGHLEDVRRHALGHGCIGGSGCWRSRRRWPPIALTQARNDPDHVEPEPVYWCRAAVDHPSWDVVIFGTSSDAAARGSLSNQQKKNDLEMVVLNLR